MSKYRETMAEALKKVYEDGHEDVSSSKRMCQTIIEDATQIRTKLDSMGPEDKLDTWWTNKLAKSADNLNSARDYIMNPIEESLELDEGRMKDIYTMQQQGKSAAEIAKLMKLPVKTVKDILGEGEEIEESLDEFTTDQIKLLKKSYGGMRGKTIAPQKANMLSKHLDRLDLFSLRQLVKEKIPFLSTLARNKIYRKTGKFEEVEQPEKEKKETENKDSVIATLKDQIAMLKQKLENEKNKAVKPEPNPETGEVPLTIGLANKLLKDKEMKKEEVIKESTDINFMKGEGAEVSYLKRHGSFMGAGKYYKFRGVNINFFVYYNEKNKNYVHQLKLTSGNRPSNDREYDKMYDVLKKLGNERRLGKLDDSDVDIYFEEADLTKPQIKKVHKMADELPKKDFKDRYGKEKGDAVRYATATNIVKKKLGIKEEMRLRVEAIAGLKKKAEKSGMPYSILKKVYDRGMAAWKGGHRPGASQHQWAFARVNSFVTKSSGTWGGADKDLAKQVRGSK